MPWYLRGIVVIRLLHVLIKRASKNSTGEQIKLNQSYNIFFGFLYSYADFCNVVESRMHNCIKPLSKAKN